KNKTTPFSISAAKKERSSPPPPYYARPANPSQAGHNFPMSKLESSHSAPISHSVHWRAIQREMVFFGSRVRSATPLYRPPSVSADLPVPLAKSLTLLTRPRVRLSFLAVFQVIADAWPAAAH